ncbi:MAG: Na(+)/H(+) antiporter subunit D [Pseudomonadota bacterium]
MIDNSMFMHPATWFIVAAFLAPVLDKARLIKPVFLMVPLAALGVIYLQKDSGVFGQVSWLGFDLVFGRMDKLSFVFLHVFVIMAFIGALYGLKVKEAGQKAAGFFYVAGALGTTLAGDYLTVFIFWELMAFSSVFLVWYSPRPRAMGAGFRYLLIHTIGGLVLLGGILLRYKTTGSLAFDQLEPASAGLAEYLILIGFILNAAVPPLHAWLADAYPEATVTGAVFMCAFTTKTAVYVLARAFPGFGVLTILGAVMTLYGVFYAVIENDARRILAYHIISQVGYMVCAVGIGTQLAINGACAHAYAHILYKALLFMGAGAVLEMTGRSKLSELGGLYRYMPWAFFFTLIGGISISGFPLTSGFISKSMIIAAAGENHQPVIMLMLTLAAVGTFLSVGIKLPYFIWFGPDKSYESDKCPVPREAGWNMNLAMAIAAFLCLFLGMGPGYHALYALLPYEVNYHPYTAYHLSETFQILALTGLGFYLFIKRLKPKDKLALDLDWFYRKGTPLFMAGVKRWLGGLDNILNNVYKTVGIRMTNALAKGVTRFDVDGIDWAIDGSAKSVLAGGDQLRHVQTGKIQHYIATAVIFLFAVIILAIMFNTGA